MELPHPPDPTWTNADRNQLALYLKTESGQKLVRKFAAELHKVNIMAVESGDPRNCGIASGMHIAFEGIMNYGTVRSPEEADLDTPRQESAAELGERLAL